MLALSSIFSTKLSLSLVIHLNRRISSAHNFFSSPFNWICYPIIRNNPVIFFMDKNPSYHSATSGIRGRGGIRGGGRVGPTGGGFSEVDNLGRQLYSSNSFRSLQFRRCNGLSVGGESRRGNGERSRGGGRGRGGGKDKIDALGRLLTRILRHMASELKLDMRSDGYVKVGDLMKLNLKTFANIPLRSHTIDEVREAVRKDNKQRFGLVEENGELLIRANQGHTIVTVESESLLKPILTPAEFPVCVHGTYSRNLESILKEGLKRMKRLHVHFSCGLPTDGGVISGMRRDVNVLIFLDVRKALEDGMKLYISENRVILTEGFDGAVPSKYFQKIETWPKRETISF